MDVGGPFSFLIEVIGQVVPLKGHQEGKLKNHLGK